MRTHIDRIPAEDTQRRNLLVDRQMHQTCVYGDNGASGNVKANMGELLVLLQKAPRAYLRIIRQRVAETRKATGGTPGTQEETEEEEQE